MCHPIENSLIQYPSPQPRKKFFSWITGNETDTDQRYEVLEKLEFMDVEVLPGDIFVLQYGSPSKYFEKPISFDVSRWDTKSQENEKGKVFCPFGKSPTNCPLSSTLIHFIKELVDKLNKNFELRWMESFPRSCSTDRFLVTKKVTLSRFNSNKNALENNTIELKFFSNFSEEDETHSKLKILIKKTKI